MKVVYVTQLLEEAGLEGFDAESEFIRDYVEGNTEVYYYATTGREFCLREGRDLARAAGKTVLLAESFS